MPSISSLLSFSWNKTKELLFPFNFKRWLKILFIVWLAGQVGGGGFNLPNPGDMDFAKSLPGGTQETAQEEQIQPSGGDETPTIDQAITNVPDKEKAAADITEETALQSTEQEVAGEEASES